MNIQKSFVFGEFVCLITCIWISFSSKNQSLINFTFLTKTSAEMFEAKLTEAITLKKIIDAIKDLVTDVNIDATPQGKSHQPSLHA